MAVMKAGLWSNGQFVEPLAARYDMAVLSWDPAQAANSGTTYTSGTMFFQKVIYPFDRVSVLGRMFSADFTGQTSLGWCLYSCDGTGVDITTGTKIATIDITSANNAQGTVRHTFTTVTGLTPGNAVLIGFLQVAATAGSTRQNAGANQTAFPNSFVSGANLNWFTVPAATGLANLAAAPSSINLSTAVASTVTGPPCHGARP